MINILGICGSPIKNSNTKIILKEAFKAIKQDGVQIEIFDLYNKKIQDCCHCNWCMDKQSKNEYCILKDDMEELYPKVVNAHALMVASPVYLGRLSGHLASVLDRIRCIHYGRYYAGGMKHKTGAAIAVSWYRNSGIETTISSIHWAFLTYQMLIAVPGSISTFGGAGVSSFSGTGDFDSKDKHQILKDKHGIKTAGLTAKSMVEIAHIIKKGKDVIV
ncbi:MAG: hypothetical protein B6I26_04315 [Desulfobacteraceae bacterium 4572_130]|nr:MAG: hypothetical protein B6I26_04315 [Desulfobacteraceae bacterium 4572_130]